MKKFKKIYYFLPLIFLIISQVASFGYRQNLLINFKAYLINYFLWLIIYFFCLSLFKKKSSSLILYITIFSLFTLTNHLKIKFLNQFFIINDLHLIKALLKFLSVTLAQLKFIEVLGILISIFVIFKIIFFIKKRIKDQNPSLKIRIPLFLFSTFILTFPIFFSNQFTKMLSTLKVDVFIWGPIENCNNNGIFFCFYDDLKNITNPAPTNYSNQTIKSIYNNIDSSIETPKDDQKTIKPTIIVILSEAFWDPTNFKEIKFSKDPISNIRKDIVSHLISPTIGNATANVEFELLTGLSNYYLHGVVPYSQSIRKEIPSLFTHFKQDGYQTTTIHPYFAPMYNRPDVYKKFGLDKFISKDNMPEAVYQGAFISDKTFVDEIIKQYQSTTQPQFIFGISMQNHFPYTAESIPKQPVDITINTTKENQDILQTYTNGIYLTDQSYLYLKKELAKSTKPTIVVTYGDHLPLLNPGFKIYQDLNYDTSDQIKMRSTPITLWSNYDAKVNIKEDFLSPNFLSLKILEFANIKPQYQFSYLQSISQTDTVIQANITPKFSPKQIQNYQLVQYDLLFGKQYSLK